MEQITLSRAIPTFSNTKDGSVLIVDIPEAAWQRIREIIQTEFDGDLVVHEYSAPGSYDGHPFVPDPHYRVDIVVDASRADELKARCAPLFHALLEQHSVVMTTNWVDGE